MKTLNALYYHYSLKNLLTISALHNYMFLLEWVLMIWRPQEDLLTLIPMHESTRGQDLVKNYVAPIIFPICE